MSPNEKNILGEIEVLRRAICTICKNRMETKIRNGVVGHYCATCNTYVEQTPL